MLLRVVGSCCAKFETGQTFSYTQTHGTSPKTAAPVSTGLYSDKMTGEHIQCKKQRGVKMGVDRETN